MYTLFSHIYTALNYYIDSRAWPGPCKHAAGVPVSKETRSRMFLTWDICDPIY